MDKGDESGGKHNKTVNKKSVTSEDGGKVHKKLLGRTFILMCYY